MYYLDSRHIDVIIKVYNKAFPDLREDEILYKMYCDKLIPEDVFLGDDD